MKEKIGYIASFILGAIFASSITYTLLSNSIKEERNEMVELRKELEKLNEGFNIPNPFARFDQKFDAIKKQFDQEIDKQNKDQEESSSIFGAIAKGVQGFASSMSSGDISEREDEQFYYFDIEVGSSDKNEINVQVQDGHLIVSGTIVSESNSGSVSSSYRSSFNQTRSLPNHIDQTNFKMDQDKEKGILTIKFPKI